MSNNSTSLPIYLNPESPLFLFDLVANFVIGLCGMLCSSIVFLVIFSTKSLRTPCFQLIGAGAVGSFMLSLHYVGRSIDFMLIHRGVIASLERTALACYLAHGIHGHFGINFHTLITCLVGVDRIVSIVYPTRYLKLKSRQARWIIWSTAILSILIEFVAVVTAPWRKVIICDGVPSTFAPIFSKVFGIGYLLVNTSIVAIYAVMLVSFHKRKTMLQRDSSESVYENFLKQQSSALPTVKFMIILYFLFGMIPSFFMQVVVNMDSGQHPWVGVLVQTGKCLNSVTSLIEFVALVCFSKKFRDRVRAVCRRNTVNVVIVSEMNRFRGAIT